MKFKHFNMHTMYKITIPALMILFAVACGSSASENKAGGDDKKAQLEKLKQQQATINEQIRALEEELAKTDTSVAGQMNAKLVALSPVKTAPFVHYIELQGKVDGDNIAYVTPRGQGGQVKAIYVKQGDYVKKGQLLMKLDDVLANQRVQQAQIAVDLAKDIYERRKNLWEKEIGTEVELLQAKTDYENKNKMLALAKEELNMSNVYAEISGVADMVNIRVGEMFTPASAAQLGIRIVNTNTLKVTVQVPENYAGKVKEGSVVEINFPDINETIKSKVSVKGSTIDPSSRSFYVEAKIPPAKNIRPNQVAMVKIQDYAVADAIAIPLSTLQNDEKGKYVMVAVKENGKLIAKKRPVEVGQLYDNKLEVKSGLKPDDTLITEGHQGLYEGQLLMTGGAA